MSVEKDLAAAGLPPLPRAAWLRIDLDALGDNLRVLAGLAGPGVRVAAVIKADAYGHGLLAAARTFVEAGAAQLCVATADEALELRSGGVTASILLLYPAPVAVLTDLAAARIEGVVSSVDGARELVDAWSQASARDVPGRAREGLRLHLEVDTGLTRMGVPVAHVVGVADRIAATRGLELVAAWSHLADPGRLDVDRAQSAGLERAVRLLREAGHAVALRHLAGSGGLLSGGVPALEMVRPGLALYGVLPGEVAVAPERRAAAAALRPALSLHARLLRVEEVSRGTAVSYGGHWVADRPSRIATVPVGYGDGFTRAYGPGGQVLVGGRRAPIVGSIAMDALMIDVTDIAGVGAGTEVVLLGAQGEDTIDAPELARRRTSIPWEVLSTLARRIPRVYHAAAGIRGVRTLAGEILVQVDPSGS